MGTSEHGGTVKWVAALGGLGGLIALVAYLWPPAETCTPQDTQSCPCPTGTGRKTCASDGRKWGECVCIAHAEPQPGPDEPLPPRPGPGRDADPSFPTRFVGALCAWDHVGKEIRSCFATQAECAKGIEDDFEAELSDTELTCMDHPAYLYCFVRRSRGGLEDHSCFSTLDACSRRTSIIRAPLAADPDRQVVDLRGEVVDDCRRYAPAR